ncbi:MAG: HAD-IA family hydrolase [Candidatus Hadarchaeales archaeon]
MPVEAVLFDIDDTIYDHKEWLAGAFLKVGELLESLFGLNRKEVRDILLQLTEKYTSAAGNLFNLLLRQIGLPEEEKLIKRIIESFYSYMPDRLTPYPAMYEVLKTLKQMGKKLGIVSDGRRDVQLQKLKALGLEGFFDVVVISDEYGREKRKPNTFPYELALKKLGVEAKCAVYVGDNPNKDFIGAKKLGMRTIRLLMGEYANVRTSIELEADFSVRNPIEILSVLDRIK